MRITCDVETTNRLCATLNMRGNGKTVRAQISVGKKPVLSGTEAEVHLMVCTKQDRNGTKYKLRSNIEKVFGKFISEGKVTFRFIQPPIDLRLSKADPIQLKGFLSIVRLGFRGESVDKVSLSSLSPATSKCIENLRKKLVVSSKKDYPILTGFPKGLDTLYINSCNMKRIDSRILQLRHLRTLNLNNNRLTSLPSDWSTLPSLAEIHLSENLLSDIPKGFCSGSLRHSLSLLDLSRNKLKMLRPWFCELHSLVTLKLNHNELVVLPGLIGLMRAVRYINASNNALRVLPASFSELHLEELDLFANSFFNDGPASTIDKLNDDGGLLELCARAVKKHKLAYSRETIPEHLYDMLDAGKTCLCGSTCFRSFIHYLRRLDLHRITATLSAIDSVGRTHAPCEAFLCSRKCFTRYKKNPQASIWK